MKKILLLTLLLFNFGCKKQHAYHLSEDERLVNAITKKVANQIYHEFDLIPCGSGGRMMNEIKMVALAFNYHKPLNVDAGRQLLVAAVEKFAFEMNANEEVRPFLYNYPFKANNIQIRIFIHRPDGSHFSSDDLCLISAIDGVLEYLSDDPNGPLFKTVHSETYEEAVAKLNDRGSVGR